MSFLSKVNARYQVQIVAAPERHNPSAEWAKEQSEESQFNPNYHVQSSTETVKSGLFLHKYHDEGKKWDYYLLSSSPNIKDHKAVISHIAGMQDLKSGKFIVAQAITRKGHRKRGWGVLLHSLVADRNNGLLSGDTLSLGEDKVFQKLAQNPKYKVTFGKKGVGDSKHIVDLIKFEERNGTEN